MHFMGPDALMDPVVKLYYEMLFIRRVEEAIAAEYSKQEMRCPVHLSIGQEAVPVGVSACLHKEDHVVSAHRSHAHYLAKGGDLNKMLCELFGKVHGCARGKGGSMHLLDLEINVTAAVPIVGSSISIGTGIGFGLQLQDLRDKVVVYFGDGATEEGSFAESLDFASLFGLSVLFVCENNFYSVCSPIEIRQSTDRNLQTICAGHGVKSFAGEGNNVLEVRSIAEQAIAYMDETSKPVLLEFTTYRWLEHCGPNWDNDLGYRKENELDDWMKKCPIEKLRKTLVGKEILSDDLDRQIEADIAQRIRNAFDYARNAPFPEVDEVHQHIYSA